MKLNFEAAWYINFLIGFFCLPGSSLVSMLYGITNPVVSGLEYGGIIMMIESFLFIVFAAMTRGGT